MQERGSLDSLAGVPCARGIARGSRVKETHSRRRKWLERIRVVILGDTFGLDSLLTS